MGRGFNRCLSHVGAAIGLTVGLFFAGPVTSQPVPLSHLVRDISVSGTVDFTSLPELQGDRLAMGLRIEVPTLFAHLDAIATARGNMGSCSRRLYWIGPTRLTRIDANGAVRLTSRVRYEQRTCGRIKITWGRTTRQVELTLRPEWIAENRSVRLNYRIDNIRNFPNWLESLLRELGVDLSGHSTITAGEGEMLDRLDPDIEAWAFESLNDGRGLAITIEMRVDGAAGLAMVFAEFGLTDLVPELSRSLISLMDWRR